MHYSCGEVGWLRSARKLSIPALVGFPRHSGFLLHLKIGIHPYFWSIVSGLSLCVQACFTAWGLITYVCVGAVTQRHREIPLGCKSRVTTTTNYYCAENFLWNMFAKHTSWAHSTESSLQGLPLHTEVSHSYVTCYRKMYLGALSTSYRFGINTIQS